MKKTLLIYFFSNYIDSSINLYTSVNKLGLLDSKNIYSLVIYQDISSFEINETIERFDKKININCYSDLYAYFIGLKNINIDNFEYFIFMNSSCIGPITPVYCELINWETIFTDNLSKVDLIAPIVEFPPWNDKNVNNLKLLEGSSSIKDLEIIPFAHSYFFALNKKATYCLLENKALPNSDISIDQAVGIYERLITSTLLSNNFRLKTLLKKFNNEIIDKKNINRIIKEYFIKNKSENYLSDPEIPYYGYFGTDLNPYEVLFFKNIRHPHSHRGEKDANISKNNFKFLYNIIGLNEAELILNKKNLNSLDNNYEFGDKTKNNLLKKFFRNILRLKI